jgi:hypothetical protein
VITAVLVKEILPRATQPLETAAAVPVQMQGAAFSPSLSDEEIAALVAGGRQLMVAGDIPNARLALQPLAEIAGNAAAAFMIRSSSKSWTSVIAPRRSRRSAILPSLCPANRRLSCRSAILPPTSRWRERGTRKQRTSARSKRGDGLRVWRAARANRVEKLLGAPTGSA